MMRASLVISALLLASQPAASPATEQAGPSPKAAPTQSGLTLGLELAKVTDSEELTRRQLDKMIDETLPRQLAANPQFVEVEASLPGFSAKLLDKMKPLIVAETMSTLPKLWDRLAAVYAASLSERELQGVIAFYRSPVGTRLIDIMSRRSDFTQALSEAMQSDGKVVPSSASLQAGLKIGVIGVNQELSPAELREVSKFEQSPLGAKLAKITPEVQQVKFHWGEDPSPELDAKIDAAVNEVVAGYMKERAPQ